MSKSQILNFFKLVYNFLHLFWEKTIFYNLFIASGAVLLTILNAWIFANKINFLLLLFIFSSTTFIYNLDRNPHNFKNFKLFFYVNIVLILVFSILAFGLKTKIWLYLTHLALISLSYAIPRSFGKWYYLSLRRIPLLKIFIIAYGWANVTVILPLLEAEQSIFTAKVLLEFSNRFLFIFIITIPFDIGDYFSDKKANIITIPILLGINKSRIS